jgi:hypothetical protein
MKGTTTDGATVMEKFGRLAKCHQQLCFAHGIQLDVIDVLYKKRKKMSHLHLNLTAKVMKTMKLIKQLQITMKS